MARATTPSARFTQLDGDRSAFIDRCERYSALTIRKLCPDENYDQNTTENTLDWQSVGATAVNHMANRMMLSMFAPSRPNFRLDPTPKLLQEAAAAQLTEEDVAAMLSAAEHKAIRVLDKKKARPKLYETMKHLIVTGNALLRRDGDLRVMGIKNYVVKRSVSGKMIELVIKERLLFDELEPEAQAATVKTSEDEHVDFYIWMKFSAGKYHVTQWVGEQQLNATFNGNYSEKDCPYHALTWDLSDSADYGTGLVEEYAGELEALSTLSEAMVQAAVLASEYRWLANPAGVTQANDLLNSANGAVIPGVKGDIEIITAGKVGELEVMLKLAESHINRVGRGFLLNSAITRNAERVTAEEIRLMAQELETGHGGVYSRLGIDLQEPIVLWVLSEVGLKINEKDVEPVIITGLDALSRNGDLDNLKRALADFAALANIPPDLLARIDLDAVARDIFAGYGLTASKYVKTNAAVAQERNAAQAEGVAMEAANAAAQSAGDQFAAPTQ